VQQTFGWVREEAQAHPWGDGGATRGELLSRVSASQAGWSASTMGVDSNTDSKRKSPKHHHRRIQRWEEEEETLIRLLGSISPNPQSLINNNKLQKKSPPGEEEIISLERERESLMIYTY
jgi:hypothetical protein